MILEAFLVSYGKLRNGAQFGFSFEPVSDSLDSWFRLLVTLPTKDLMLSLHAGWAEGT
jgi:hypothetical protein